MPFEVPVPAAAPMRREWTLVCAAPDYPACVTGWEFPTQPGATDAGRRFEVLWSVDPQVVGMPLTSSPASADLRRAAGLLYRMTGYLG
jgi:MerR family transcriptional regulator, light-induced transcriptional regulator